MRSLKIRCSGVIIASVALVLGGTPPVVSAAEESLDEITVTARKREESLQDISAAVSVLTGETVRQNVINDIRDLQAIVPYLTVGEAVGVMKINMRALSNSTVVRNEDSEVVLHVDGAVISRLEAQASAFFDLERIEVLRGPQGTLYGRNSTGGTVNLVTAKPTEEFSGYVDATVGNYNLVRLESAVAGPISSKVRGRVAVQSIGRDGYSDNIAEDGNDFNDDRRWGIRGHLQFDVSDTVQFLLTGEYTTQNDASGHLTYLAPRFDGVDPPGTGFFSDPKSRDGYLSTQPQMDRETRSITGTLDWQINDSFSLRSITNYRDLDFFNWSDLDVSGVVFVDVGLPMEHEQISQELQLGYNSENLHAMLGLFYYKEEFSGSTDVYIRPSSLLFQFTGSSETEALSPFWNATYNASDQFTLRAGGRLNSEDREIINFSGVNGNLAQSDVATDSRSFDEYTGEYGIDFNITDNALVYYTFAQGFRSGAALVMQVDSPIIDPTTVDSHEVGLKFQTNDGRFMANFAIFDATVNDLQRTQATAILDANGNVTGAGLRVNNIAEMDTSGVEVDMLWQPTDAFRLNVAAVFIDAEFASFLTVDPFDPVFDTVQVAGNRPRLTPDYKANINAEYDFALANDRLLTAGLNLNFVGEQFFDEFNRSPFQEDAYSLVNARLAYGSADGDWKVTLWGKNLGDEDVLYDTNYSAFGGMKNKFLIPPLTWGVTASFAF